MFKAKIKLRTTHSIISIGMSTMMIFCASYNNIYGNTISMDSLLQKISQLWAQWSIEDWASHIGQKDLFLTTLQTHQAWENKSSLQTIEMMLRNIQTLAQNNNNICTIARSDIMTILSTQWWFIKDFYDQSTLPLWTTVQSSWNSKKSCEQLLRCMWNLPNWTITENKQIEDCTSNLYTLYTTQKYLKASQLSLPEQNNNDNIYMDGIKENALFDLMIDITNIKNILFEQGNNDIQTPKMIYYSLPTVKTSTSTNNQNTIPGSIGWWWGTSTNSTINTTLWGGNGWWGNSTNNNWTINWWSPSSNSTTTTINNFLEEINNNTQPQNDTINSLPTSTIQKTLCPIPGSKTDIFMPESWDGETNSWNTTDLIDDLYTTQYEILNALSGFLYTPDNTSWLWIPWWNNNGGSNIIKTDSAIPWTTLACKNTCADKTGTEKLICEWKCCMNTCNQISNIKDKAICLSQCLCGEVSTANDMLRIKICRVPAQPARVLAGKKINSIEEAINEINEIFNKLKQDWLLSKRSKKQEFMDSSFSNIKFHEVLSFDIFVAIKPIYDKLQLKQVQDNIIQNHDTIKSVNPFLWWNKTLWKWKDKNKYLIIGENKSWDDWIKYCNSMGVEFNPQQKKCVMNTQNSSNILQNLSKNNSSSLFNDNFYKFSKEQYLLREQIYKQVVDIQSNSTLLRTKAENAK